MTSTYAASAKLRRDAQRIVSLIRDAGGRIDYALARQIFREHIAKGHTVIFGLVAALAASRTSAAAMELTDETALDLASLPMIDSFEEIGFVDGDCVTEEAIAAAVEHIHDAAHEAAFAHHAHNPLSANPFADPFADPYRNVHADHDDHADTAAHHHGASHGAGHALRDHTHHTMAHAGHQSGHHHGGHQNHGAHEISASSRADHTDHDTHDGHHGNRGHVDLAGAALGAEAHSFHGGHAGHMAHATPSGSGHTAHMGHAHHTPAEFGADELSALMQTGDRQPIAPEDAPGSVSTLAALDMDLVQDAATSNNVPDQHGHHHNHSAHSASVAEEVTMLELESVDALPQVDGPIFA